MTDETRKMIEWCIRQLDRMHDDLIGIQKDIEELKVMTSPWKSRNFDSWLERQSNSTDA